MNHKSSAQRRAGSPSTLYRPPCGPSTPIDRDQRPGDVARERPGAPAAPTFQNCRRTPSTSRRRVLAGRRAALLDHRLRHGP